LDKCIDKARVFQFSNKKYRLLHKIKKNVIICILLFEKKDFKKSKKGKGISKNLENHYPRKNLKFLKNLLILKKSKFKS